MANLALPFGTVSVHNVHRCMLLSLLYIVHSLPRAASPSGPLLQRLRGSALSDRHRYCTAAAHCTFLYVHVQLTVSHCALRADALTLITDGGDWDLSKLPLRTFEQPLLPADACAARREVVRSVLRNRQALVLFCCREARARRGGSPVRAPLSGAVLPSTLKCTIRTLESTPSHYLHD